MENTKTIAKSSLLQAMRSIAIIALIAVIGSAVFVSCGGDTDSASSLEGFWVKDGDSSIEINVKGNSGTYANMNFSSALYKDAVTKGYIKRGDKAWRNLTSLDDFKFSGQELRVTYRTATPDVALGTQFGDVRINLSADGKSLTVSGRNASGSYTDFYKRR